VSELRERVPMRSERRTVTSLFADLSNFTGLRERLDPEDLTTLVRECFGELVAEIRVRDGWLEKHIGDALVAFFGAPLAHEDDPMRAVSTALAIRDRVRALSERVREQVGAPLDVHVGINTGLAVVAPALDHGAGDEFMVLGDSVNVAVRLQQVADSGQILVGEATYRATASLCEYRRLPPLKLKGKQERVHAWECLGARAVSEPESTEVVGGWRV
jgi:class 3 adenylate cyclase